MLPFRFRPLSAARERPLGGKLVVDFGISQNCLIEWTTANRARRIPDLDFCVRGD